MLIMNIAAPRTWKRRCDASVKSCVKQRLVQYTPHNQKNPFSKAISPSHFVASQPSYFPLLSQRIKYYHHHRRLSHMSRAIARKLDATELPFLACYCGETFTSNSLASRDTPKITGSETVAVHLWCCFSGLSIWQLKNVTSQRKTRWAREPESNTFFLRSVWSKSTAENGWQLSVIFHIFLPERMLAEYFTPKRSMFQTHPETCFVHGLCPPTSTPLSSPSAATSTSISCIIHPKTKHVSD